MQHAHVTLHDRTWLSGEIGSPCSCFCPLRIPVRVKLLSECRKYPSLSRRGFQPGSAKTESIVSIKSYRETSEELSFQRLSPIGRPSSAVDNRVPTSFTRGRPVSATIGCGIGVLSPIALSRRPLSITRAPASDLLSKSRMTFLLFVGKSISYC